MGRAGIEPAKPVRATGLQPASFIRLDTDPNRESGDRDSNPNPEDHNLQCCRYTIDLNSHIQPRQDSNLRPSRSEHDALSD